MSDIPDDVIETARVLNMRLHSATELGQRTQWIAEALMAERERSSQLLSEADKRAAGARAKALEDVLSALTAHELYQYRPKAFQGFIEYARREFGSTPVRKPAVDSGESGDE